MAHMSLSVLSAVAYSIIFLGCSTLQAFSRLVSKGKRKAGRLHPRQGCQVQYWMEWIGLHVCFTLFGLYPDLCTEIDRLQSMDDSKRCPEVLDLFDHAERGTGMFILHRMILTIRTDFNGCEFRSLWSLTRAPSKRARSGPSWPFLVITECSTKHID